VTFLSAPAIRHTSLFLNITYYLVFQFWINTIYYFLNLNSLSNGCDDVAVMFYIIMR